MKKGQIYQGVAGEIRFPNRAVVETAEGEQCLVDNVLPGQKVEFRVEKAKNGRFQGRLIRVIEKSEIETAKDVCPHFGVCGGCLYQSVPYIQQLRFKEYQVRSLLDKVQEDYKWEGIKSSPAQTAYRNKMEFSFGNEYKDGPLTLGLHRRGGFYDIVPVNECRIVDEDFRKILMITQMYFRAFSLSFYHKLTHEGVLRHLLVRKGLSTGEIMVGLVTTSGISEEILAGFTASLQSLSTNGTIESILHMQNDNPADMVQSEKTTVLYGRDYIYSSDLKTAQNVISFKPVAQEEGSFICSSHDYRNCSFSQEVIILISEPAAFCNLHRKQIEEVFCHLHSLCRHRRFTLYFISRLSGELCSVIDHTLIRNCQIEQF